MAAAPLANDRFDHREGLWNASRCPYFKREFRRCSMPARAYACGYRQGEEIQRTEVSLAKNDAPGAGGNHCSLGRYTIICAGVSDLMSHYIESHGIHIISGIAGEPDNIVDAYIHHRLGRGMFQMPGRKRPYPAGFVITPAASQWFDGSAPCRFRSSGRNGRQNQMNNPDSMEES